MSRRNSDGGSLTSPVQRDGLLNKGLIYAPERGLVVPVPHMPAYLRSLATHEFADEP